MKYKRFTLIFLLLLLSACLPPPKHPTPFMAGERKAEVHGCEKLKEEVKEWNKNNPDNQKVADC